MSRWTLGSMTWLSFSLILSAGFGRSHLCFHYSFNSKQEAFLPLQEDERGAPFYTSLQAVPRGATFLLLVFVPRGPAQALTPECAPYLLDEWMRTQVGKEVTWGDSSMEPEDTVGPERSRDPAAGETSSTGALLWVQCHKPSPSKSRRVQ